jgi:GNAT superfamily N-acetyltransferase
MQGIPRHSDLPPSSGPRRASPTDLRIEPVSRSSQLGDFIRVPIILYRDHPSFVAPINYEVRHRLNPRSNPYFDHADVQLWVAYRGSRPVGRISAQVDELVLEHQRDLVGHMGFLDAVDDQEVFAALTAQAERWLADKGMRRVMGPFNLSINEECGLLVDGFDSPTAFMLGFNLPYARERLAELGYRKAKDTLGHVFDPTRPLSPRAQQQIRRAQRLDRVRLRLGDVRRFREEALLMGEIFNDAWSRNWGFVPITDEEMIRLARDMRPLIKPELIHFVEIDGEAAGMLLCLPDIYDAIGDLRGALLPIGWVKLLWRLKVRGVRSARVPLMGLRKRYHRTAVGFAAMAQMLEAARIEMVRSGFRRVDLSWTLEDNLPMLHVFQAIGATRHKTYRIFEKQLI